MTMTHLKMRFDLYDDVKQVAEAICYLHGMIDTLEMECMHRDEGKTATELFIIINNLKREIEKMESESKRMLYRADLDQFGPLSKYVRPYLAF